MISTFLKPKRIIGDGDIYQIDLYEYINIESYKKSFNWSKEKYRFKRTKKNKCTIVYVSKLDLKVLLKNNLVDSNHKFKQHPYNHYFFRRFFWYVRKKAKLKLTTKETLKKIILASAVATIATIASYAIMKFIFKWF